MDNRIVRAAGFILYFVCFLANIHQASAQTACPNSNFSTGTFDSWTGCYGTFTPNTCTQTGFLTVPTYSPYQPALHKMINSAWVDANTNCNGNGLVTLYPGEGHVARIGDTSYYNPTPAYKASEMKYAISVSAGVNDFFIYRFAVVLQSGGHMASQQPDFIMEITDASGNKLDPYCGYYHLTAPTAGPPAPGSGFTLCSSNIYWTNWIAGGFDLSPYSGQTVYVRFKVQGCIYKNHFGYAYISAQCGSFLHTVNGCAGATSVTMTGPSGFAGYEWRGPGTNGPVVGTSQECTITAAQGAVTGNTFYLNLTCNNGCVISHPEYTISLNSISAAFLTEFNGTGASSTFTDVSTGSDPSRPIVSRRWRFDAGGDFTPMTANAVITHTYVENGPHEVTLESFSQDGCMGTTTQAIGAAPPAMRNLENIEVMNGQSNCYDATQTITVAGNGTSFAVEDGGSSTLIAGQNILYEPTSTVLPGGYMHGMITPAGPYCQTPSLPAVITNTAEPAADAGKIPFSLRPNPTEGPVIIGFNCDTPKGPIVVKIYGMQGELVLSESFTGETNPKISLTGKPAGIYLIRVTNGRKTWGMKVVKL